MATNPPKTPQQKKSLSYAKDMRNIYGENDKSSRKAIPARKASENRKVRRKAKQTLERSEHVNEEKADLIESSLRHDTDRVGGWTIGADQPLGKIVSWKNDRNSDA